jgi:DNA-directed RNA polymerase subunit M/transcription elongation factor TFIIS
MDCKFCEKCKTLLSIITTDSVLSFKCRACGTEQAATPSDTLLSSKNNYDRLTLHGKRIRESYYDPTNPKVEHKCPECSETIVRCTRSNDLEKIIYVCKNRHFCF